MSVKVVLARDALAADEVVGRDLDAGDLDRSCATLPNASVPTSTVVWPPSTGSTAPLTYDASAESSQATAPRSPPAMLGRRSGTSARHRRVRPPRGESSRAPSASISPSAIGVRTQPGQTQFARTPAGPWSRAMHCVSIASAAFDEQ